MGNYTIGKVENYWFGKFPRMNENSDEDKILKYVFIEIFIFGCRGYLGSMQFGYGLDAKLN